MHHFPKTKKKYKSLNSQSARTKECAFCTTAQQENVLAENETMYVIKNRVAYDLFEGYRVSEHVMVIPRQHRLSMREFNEQEKIDFFNLAAVYETEGFCVFARGLNSPSRSVDHQHTHLIKIQGKPVKSMLYAARPHVLIVK